jgi:hypothetical protein
MNMRNLVIMACLATGTSLISCSGEEYALKKSEYGIESLAKHLLNRFDSNHDGQIDMDKSYPESHLFEPRGSKQANGSSQSYTRYINGTFREADRQGNNDRIATLEEIVAFLSTFDTNGDGKLTYLSRNGSMMECEYRNYLMKGGHEDVKNVVLP